METDIEAGSADPDGEATEPAPAEDRTPGALAEDNKIDGIVANWNTDVDWNGHDYAAIPIPRETTRPKWEWDTTERRAYLLKKLHEHGTWSNVPMSQYDVADQFGVPQPCIHTDIKELRRYIRFHAGDRAISMTETVAQHAVSELLEDGKSYKALRAQLEYNEWLFELGRLERAPDKKQVHNINQKVADDTLDPDEQEHFQNLSEKIQKADEAQADEIVVENKTEDEDTTDE